MKFLTAIYIALSGFCFAQSPDDYLAIAKSQLKSAPIQVFLQPTAIKHQDVSFKFDEIKLVPGDVVLFRIPESIANQPINSITFGHRQNERGGYYDHNPAYTKLSVLGNEDKKELNWYVWAGSHSGRIYGSKFAEQRKASEDDTLYEWLRVGHYQLENDRVKRVEQTITKTDKDGNQYTKTKNVKVKSKEPLFAKVIKVENVGRDSLLLSKVVLSTYPSNPAHVEEFIFSGKSSFGDIETQEGRFYDGGQNHRGQFPGSFRLSSRNEGIWDKLPAQWIQEKEKAIIPLTMTSKTLTYLEVMCGDTKPDGRRNKDNGWGSLGNAKFSAYIHRPSSDEVFELAKKKNVPSQGVLNSSPPKNYKSAPGDVLVIENYIKSSPMYIMGIRLMFK
jgi:hypothetical protein